MGDLQDSSRGEGIAGRDSRKSRPKDPAGVFQGQNSWTDKEYIGYRGPLPPPGSGVHHYHFKLYALDAPLEAEPGLDKKVLSEKMQGHILAEGELMGTYQRETGGRS